MTTRTMFSSELLENPMLFKMTLASVVTILVAGTFNPLQKILQTTDLTSDQWMLCLLVSLSLVMVVEVKKKLGVTTAGEVDAAPSTAAATA